MASEGLKIFCLNVAKLCRCRQMNISALLIALQSSFSNTAVGLRTWCDFLDSLTKEDGYGCASARVHVGAKRFDRLVTEKE